MPTVFTIKSKRVPPPRHARNRLHRKVTVSSENELSTYDFPHVSCFWSKSESLFSLNGTSCTYMDQYFRASAYNLRVTCRITSTYYTVAHRTRTFFPPFYIIFLINYYLFTSSLSVFFFRFFSFFCISIKYLDSDVNNTLSCNNCTYLNRFDDIFSRAQVLRTMNRQRI